MGSHQYGFYRKHIDHDEIILVLLNEDLGFTWSTGETITETTFNNVRTFLYDFTIKKSTITARDVQYMQQFLSAKDCPHECRRKINILREQKNIVFSILD